ncbi:MAG: hypothetical protein ACSHWN_01990 [Methylophilaceae bacterium]
MIIQTTSYQNLANQYSKAIAWMESLGIQVDKNRVNHYKKTIEYCASSYKTATTEDMNNILPDFISSVIEIHSFIEIFSAFKDIPSNQLTKIIKKLQISVNGPLNSISEKAKTTTARNYLFEAYVAARCHRPGRGVSCILDASSDTGIKIEDKKIWIECKRITSQNQLEKNIRDATKQLEKVMAKQTGSCHRGVVALEISKILTTGNEILASEDDDSLIKATDAIMDSYIKENHHVWESIYKRRSKKILGMLVSFSFMSSSKDRNLLVHATQWGLNPKNTISANDETALRKLALNLKDY